MGSAKEVADRHVAAFNAHDPEAHAANETEDIEWVMPGGIVLRGPEQVIGLQKIYWEAFPDVKVTALNQIVADPYVVTEGTFTGTHKGTLRTPQGDIAATGNELKLRYVSVQRIEKGKVASEHLYFDQAEFMTQLGLAPAPSGS